MALLLKKVEWTGKSYYGELTDVIKINIRQSVDTKANTCDITLLNPLNKTVNNHLHHKYVDKNGEVLFSEGDTIKVYLAYSDTARTIDTASTSYDLIMTAEVSEFEVNCSENRTQILLKCVDKTFVVFNKLWNFNYDSSQALTAPQIIQAVIQQITSTSGAYAYDPNGHFNSEGIYSIDARLMTSSYPGDTGSPPAYIQTKRPNNTDFPVTTIAKTFKPAYEFIKELSTPNHTNTQAELTAGTITCDRNYIFYVDQDNRFHWFYPEDSNVTTLSSNINDTVESIPLINASSFLEAGIIQVGSELIKYNNKSGNNLINVTRGYNNTIASSHSSGDTVSSALVLTVGSTSTGFNIYSYKMTKKTFDVINMVIFNAGADLYGSGILDYFYDQNTDSKELKMTYKPYVNIAKDLIYSEIKSGRLTQDNTTPGPFTYDGNFYKETTGTYNGGAGITTGWGTLVTSNSTYNTSLRTISVVYGDQAASRLTASRGSPRWKGSIELSGKRFTPGDLIRFTSYQAGIINQDLRIKEVQHNFDKNGWFTTLTIEQDERKLGE